MNEKKRNDNEQKRVNFHGMTESLHESVAESERERGMGQERREDIKINVRIRTW